MDIENLAREQHHVSVLVVGQLHIIQLRVFFLFRNVYLRPFLLFFIYDVAVAC